jgi:hypothetical protein
MQTCEVAAVVATVILGADALVHVNWLTGRTWPARDPRTLFQVVLNADVPFTPRVLMPLVVVLAVGATAVLAKAGLLTAWLPDRLPGWLPTAGTLAVAVGHSYAAAPASSGRWASAPIATPPSTG